LNILRGDIARLGRCTGIVTGGDLEHTEGTGGVDVENDMYPLPRAKPFKFAYEREIVMFAYFKKLDYFSTECKYAPFAARGFARDYIRDLEHLRPRAVLDLIRAAESFRVATNGDTKKGTVPIPRNCARCGYLSSQEFCKACLLLEGLNTGNASLAWCRTPRRKGGLSPE
jgi:cytoplasmic tRNA 2-thiolation protein 1